MKRALLVGLVFASGLASQTMPVIPPQPDLLLRAAYDAEIKEDREGALALYEKYLSQGEESAFVRGQESRLYAALGRKQDAVRLAKKAIDLAPDRKEYYVLYAELLRQYGRSEEAYKLLRDAVLKFQDDSEVEFFLAEACNETGRISESILHYHQTLYYPATGSTRYPVYRSVALLRLAVYKLRRQEREAARKYLTRYLDLNPDRLYPRYLLATDVLFDMGDFEGAMREMEFVWHSDRSLYKDAAIEEPRLRGALALVHFYFDTPEAEGFLAASARDNPGLFPALLATQQKKDQEAAALLLPILKANPAQLFGRIALYRILSRRGGELTGERMSLAAILMQNNRVRDGIALLEESAAEAKSGKTQIPLWKIERMIAQSYLKLKQPYRALLSQRDAMAGVPQDSPSMAEMQLELAKILSGNPINRDQEAVSILDGLIANGNENALYHRALIHQSLGACQDANRDWLEIERMKGPQMEAAFLRGGCAESMGDFAEAEKAFREVYSKRSDLPLIQNSLAYVLSLQGKELQEARSLIEKAVAADSDDAHFQDTYGWIYFQTGDHLRARYHLQFASRLLDEEGDRNAEVFDHLGHVYEALGQNERSLYYFDSAYRILAEKAKRMPFEENLMKNIQSKMEKQKK
ncbi:MAG TPA: tetratricopeptide repeat protein [Leptospiraceae bacterium]|nr:tetratricopeptide repeat protein [Leptospirales bacterium]HMW59548.1 tetratricopeptide repeat protein [Leptospiraceae bacterium]HMX57520.1 tetratricopeptide repeat protein [Leptospiraceae bacterium]HNE22154.1 tetratricopeptide repeat protein [Leptospiraceae bacterium]HNN73367.1 tetratricopeptide repeat protein [Leptospiraceae bacterium]